MSSDNLTRYNDGEHNHPHGQASFTDAFSFTKGLSFYICQIFSFFVRIRKYNLRNAMIFLEKTALIIFRRAERKPE